MKVKFTHSAVESDSMQNACKIVLRCSYSNRLFKLDAIVQYSFILGWALDWKKPQDLFIAYAKATVPKSFFYKSLRMFHVLRTLNFFLVRL